MIFLALGHLAMFLYWGNLKWTFMILLDSFHTVLPLLMARKGFTFDCWVNRKHLWILWHQFWFSDVSVWSLIGVILIFQLMDKCMYFFSWSSDGVKCKQIGVQDLLKWMTKVDQKIDKKWKRTTNSGGKADIVLFKIAKQDLFICMGQPRKIEGKGHKATFPTSSQSSEMR